jgi:hypothetical protein
MISHEKAVVACWTVGDRMKTSRYATLVPILVVGTWMGFGTLLLAQQPVHKDLDLTVTKPEAVGFSSIRLERLHTLMQHTVNEK